MPFSNAGTSTESFHQSCLGKNSVVPPRNTNRPTISNPRRKPNKQPKSLSSAPIETEARILRSILPTKPARNTHPITIKTMDTNVLVMRPMWAWNGRTAAYEGKYFADHAAGGPKECREQNNDNEDPVEFSKTQGRKIHTYLTDWTLPVFKPAKPSLAFAASASLADLKGPACTR